MKTYKIQYRDKCPNCPVFTLRVNAYNREHARELFFEMGDFPDDESWEIISITLPGYCSQLSWWRFQRRKTMKNKKQNFYAWVGQNASCGTPNLVTGRMSMYGTNYKFRTKGERDQFVDEHHDPNGNNFAVACSVRDLRGYNLGQSVQQFEDDLVQSPYLVYDDDRNEWIEDYRS
jgi:hypothetical protein